MKKLRVNCPRCSKPIVVVVQDRQLVTGQICDGCQNSIS